MKKLTKPYKAISLNNNKSKYKSDQFIFADFE